MTRKTAYGVLTLKIIKAIEQHGPMTRTEICNAIQRERHEVSATVSRLIRPGRQQPQRLYISGYIYDSEGQRRYPRAIYAIGDLPNKPRPKPQTLENKRRYWAKWKAIYQGNSVFNLGLTREQIRQRLREAKAGKNELSTGN